MTPNSITSAVQMAAGAESLPTHTLILTLTFLRSPGLCSGRLVGHAAVRTIAVQTGLRDCLAEPQLQPQECNCSMVRSPDRSLALGPEKLAGMVLVQEKIRGSVGMIRDRWSLDLEGLRLSYGWQERCTSERTAANGTSEATLDRTVASICEPIVAERSNRWHAETVHAPTCAASARLTAGTQCRDGSSGAADNCAYIHHTCPLSVTHRYEYHVCDCWWTWVGLVVAILVCCQRIRAVGRVGTCEKLPQSGHLLPTEPKQLEQTPSSNNMHTKKKGRGPTHTRWTPAAAHITTSVLNTPVQTTKSLLAAQFKIKAARRATRILPYNGRPISQTHVNFILAYLASTGIVEIGTLSRRVRRPPRAQKGCATSFPLRAMASLASGLCNAHCNKLTRPASEL